jgi:hypothetical protein
MEYTSKNIKKVAAGIIAGAAITSAPLVAFAAPAFADTGGAPIPGGGVLEQIPATAMPYQRIVSTGGGNRVQEQHVLVNAASAGSLRDGNAARCGGGINF